MLMRNHIVTEFFIASKCFKDDVFVGAASIAAGNLPRRNAQEANESWDIMRFEENDAFVRYRQDACLVPSPIFPKEIHCSFQLVAVSCAIIDVKFPPKMRSPRYSGRQSKDVSHKNGHSTAALIMHIFGTI